jgi:predicted Zn-ribbon and HTH transcriptional regulator
MDVGGGGGAAVCDPPPPPQQSDYDDLGMWGYEPRGISPRPRNIDDELRDLIDQLYLHLAAAAPAAAPAPGPACDVMPADVARYAIEAALGECAISREELESMTPDQKAVTTCGHVFKKDYIMRMKELDGHRCPACRKLFEINPIHEVDVVGPTFVPRHMKDLLVIRAIAEGKVQRGLSESAYHLCDRCGTVVDKIPVPNECPKCKKMGAFSGGSRKHKRNIHRKSKRLIKRKKTMKRR